MKQLKLWAIIDVQKKQPRFCYAHEDKNGGIMAIYDRKPTIEKKWRDAKKVVRISIDIPTP
jgi:hypothetical protein